jgi:hypothetical protein
MVVVPVGKKLPGGTPLRETVGVPQSSDAVGVPNWLSPTICPQLLVVTLTSGGAVIVGGVVSEPDVVIVIVCVQDACRPPSSVAVQAIVVVPTGYGSL